MLRVKYEWTVSPQQRTVVQLFFVRERENFERSGISVPVVILLLVVAAVGQHVPLGVPGNSECWGRDADLGDWKERKQLISVTKQ